MTFKSIEVGVSTCERAERRVGPKPEPLGTQHRELKANGNIVISVLISLNHNFGIYFVFRSESNCLAF